MEDFSWENTPNSQVDPSKQSNLQGVVANSSSVLGKASFLLARLNKDNFWNVIFFVGTSLCVLIAQILSDTIPGGVAILLFTLISAPYFIARVNRIEYKENILCSSSTGRPLLNHLPKNLGFILWLSIPFTAFGILFIHDKYPSLDENLAIYNALFWFIPTMYFIFKNCPVSVIFNKLVWANPTSDGQNSSSGTSTNAHTYSALSLTRLRNSPINSWHNTNIYNRNR